MSIDRSSTKTDDAEVAVSSDPDAVDPQVVPDPTVPDPDVDPTPEPAPVDTVPVKLASEYADLENPVVSVANYPDLALAPNQNYDVSLEQAALLYETGVVVAA